jgi:protocatechuate 3,4-dioxygenase beta subunit
MNDRQPTDPRRRRALLAMSGVLLPVWALAERRLQTTPAQGAGPFYPPELPLDDDNDLTRVAGRSDRAAGRITDLHGQLRDSNGRPLHGMRIEIWQCDANGRYRHPRERGREAPDPNFQGHGHTLTDAQGRYRFRTIRPVPYPGRTPHIHIAVFPEGDQPFTTQLYVAGEPRNQDDMLYRLIPSELRALVTADFVPAADPVAELQAAFDIVLAAPSAA